MNIEQEILDYADTFDNVEAISTGGGMDYIYRKFDNGAEGIVSADTMDGSPESLDEKAGISLFFSDEWTDGLVINFDTARAAIANLALIAEF